jgi:hypothetical protein
MSHIDTIDHSHIGFLAGIPVYHPLGNDQEYGLTPRTIAVGGGSGEHSIFLLNDIDECIKYYIYYHSDDFDCYTDKPLYTSYWSIEDGYRFYKSVKEDMQRVDVNSAEKYIVLAVAEYLLHFGEHIIDPVLLAKAKTLTHSPNIYAIKEDVNKDISFGKIIVDGKVKWGYTFEEESVEHANLNTHK